jgi:hypothetical protein
LGENPAFNEIITSGGTYTADLSYNRFRLLAGEGVGMVNGPAGSNQTTIYGKSFTNVDVSGENAFYAFANNTLNPTIRVATTGTIQARSDPATNTLFIDGPVSNPYIVSTGQYGFYQVKVTGEASTITSSLQGWGGDFITANSPSTLLRLIGYNDIQLSTNVTTNSVFFTISTFTSKGYLDTSTVAAVAYPNSISTVSSLYTSLAQFNSTVSYLSSYNGFSFSSVVSSIDALAMSTGEQFYTLTGLINARVTFDQERYDFTSTVAGLGSAGYLSTGGGAVVGIDQFNSTIEGLGSLGYVSSVSTLQTSSIFNTGAISTYSLEVFGPATLTASGSTILRGPIYLGGPTYIAGAVTTGPTAGLLDTTTLFSSLEGLGSLGYISTASLVSTVAGISFNSDSLTSTVAGLGSAGYISTASLVSTVAGISFNSDSLTSTVAGLGSAGYISTASLVSTVAGISLNSDSLTSTVDGLGSAGYISTASLVSTVAGISFNSGLLTSTVDGLGSAGYISTASLVSTVAGLGSSDYISTASLVSTVAGISLNSGSLTSTVEGLGSSGYISTLSLFSTVEGLGSANYVSTLSLQSTLAGIGISTGSLFSTVTGLGSANYVSTLSLQSTFAGIGISTGSLFSTVRGLGSANYVSTASLFSTVEGLGSANYVSTLSLQSTLAGIGISTGSLFSTVRGLGSANYVSTLSLQSTFAGIGISTGSIVSTVTGLGSANYVSTLSLQSTFAGIGISTGSLFSTVRGLGSANYVSTLSLTSTVQGIQANVGFPSSISSIYGSSFTTQFLLASTLSYLNIVQQSSITVAGGNSVIVYSSDGLVWQPTNYGFGGTVQWIGYNGEYWLAAANTGVYSSANIINWTQRATGIFSQNTNALVWGNGIWVIGGINSPSAAPTLKYSFDGITWFNGANSFTDTCLGLAFNGTMFIAVGNPTQTIKYSYDGKTWINASGSVMGSYGQAIGWNGRMWVAGGQLANNIKYSYDGINWLSANTSFGTGCYGVAWNGLYWVAGGQGGVTIKYSFDGINWTDAAAGTFSTNCLWVSWNGKVWIAYGQGGGSIKWSIDGSTWVNSTGSLPTSVGKCAFYNPGPMSYRQANLNILPDFAPSFQYSTNQIFMTTSSINLNNRLIVDLQGIVDVEGILTASSIITPTLSVSTVTSMSSLTFGSGSGWIVMGAAQAAVISTIQQNTALSFISTLYVGSTNTIVRNYTAQLNGNVLASTLMIGNPLSVFSTQGFRLTLTHDSAMKPFTTVWNTSSDKRVKENIRDADIDRCYDDIKALPLRRFTWQEGFYNSSSGIDRNVIGFIAQEVSTIIPKSVSIMEAYGYKDFQFLNIDQINMSFYGALKRTIKDKEYMDSTIKGQRVEIETLKGTTSFILSTLEGLQGR